MDKPEYPYCCRLFYKILCVYKLWNLKSYKQKDFSKILSSKIPHIKC